MENNFKFYNTLTRQIDTVVPRVDGKIGMYTCGPTVYHFAHIGNIRSYIMEDVLEKALRYVGYDVKRVMNITDVGHLSSDGDTGEDKMLKGAKREHKSVMEVAKEYTDAFFKDFTAVHIQMPADVVEPATTVFRSLSIWWRCLSRRAMLILQEAMYISIHQSLMIILCSLQQ